jgi:ribosomal protein L33
MEPTVLLALPKEFVLRIFIALKNQLSSAGFKSENLGSNVKYATTRPQRTTTERLLKRKYAKNFIND